MQVTPPPRTGAYLLHSLGFVNVFNIPTGELELTNSTVRFTLTSPAGYAGWIAERLRIPDLNQRLKAGQHVTVFEYHRNGCSINWPKTSMGSVFQISRGNDPSWIVGFLRPGRGGVIGLAYIVAERRARKEWRSALSSPAPAPRQMTPTSPPPGWYPDPAGGPTQRYWDGSRWN